MQVLLKHVCLAGWSLDSPSHSEYTDSCSSYQLCDPRSTLERANYDAQSGQIPLWEGLNLQSLWCSMLPVVSSALCLLCLALLFSVFSPPLRVHCSPSFLVSQTPPYSSLIRLSLFMALAIRFSCLFGSSPACVDSPSACVLGVPCSASA